MEPNMCEKGHSVKIAALPGDGIGKEVLPAAVQVLDSVATREQVQISWTWFDWGCDYYKIHGRMMPEDGLAILRQFDAIFLGAIGDPEVPDDISLWNLLMPIRRDFDLFVNLRPVRSFDGLPPRVRLDTGAPVDFLIILENTEGDYSESGGRSFRGTEREIAIQNDIFSRIGIERITRFAFDEARKRHGRVVSATKSNGIIHSMPFWDEVVAEVAAEYPEVQASKRLIDALAADLVMYPESFDVIVASNLYGDILSDLGAAIVGSLGIAASANISLRDDVPSMFEPVHGSAPDIAGKGIANPVAAVWSGALMLEHLGHSRTANRVMDAIEHTLRNPATRTADLGGSSTTEGVCKALIDYIMSAA
jgi:tartrate dehydrogenase/decarboxylase/D-malate dehydrogenase